MKTLELNGVKYQWPQQPVVVVCIDGGDPSLHQSAGVKDGIIPNIEQFMKEGFAGIANGTVPRALRVPTTCH
jgi:phosphonoacetate hydrolase